MNKQTPNLPDPVQQLKDTFRHQLLCCACLDSVALHPDFYILSGVEADCPIKLTPRIVPWGNPSVQAGIRENAGVIGGGNGDTYTVSIGLSAICVSCVMACVTSGNARNVRLMIAISDVQLPDGDGNMRPGKFLHYVRRDLFPELELEKPGLS